MKKIAIILAIVVIFSAVIYYALPVPEPERCSLCDSFPRHAPCILKLGTGELVELAIYDPHPYKVGEIADEQPGGYFSFVCGAGLDGDMVAAEYLTATIPIESESMNKEYFCNNCRRLLDDYKRCGYVLVDLKDTRAPILYSIEEGTSFSLRCYEVEIGKNEENDKYELMIRGTFNE